MLVKEKRLALVELIAVLTIIGIIATIAVPSVAAMIKKTKQEVCLANMLQLERAYNIHLILKGIEFSEVVFEQYLQEFGHICEGDCEVAICGWKSWV
ncbi:hypothetical protein [Bacillus sp. FJAT-45350]|uniref:hypothetical protein n=1 Tax=Bacillus sp. FJAT-45350 TaxID=2011014 RepID=UPI0011550CBC|nr:hypothetical protein [Bacillus sp. FJAT-45350]